MWIDSEGTNGFVFAAYIDFVFFSLLNLFSQTLRDQTHLSTFICEIVHFIFASLDLFRQTSVLSLFFFYLRSNVTHHSVIVTIVLFYLTRLSVEVQDSLGKRVKEFCIVRNHQDGLAILPKEFCQVFDTGCV